MNRIAIELDAKLNSLDQQRAEKLSKMVRDAIAAVDHETLIDRTLGVENGYPVGYFADSAGALADEPFERPPQGEKQCSR